MRAAYWAPVLAVGAVVGSALLLYALLAALIWWFGATRASARDIASGHVVVTGGSSGIGLEVARQYLRASMKVTIIARSQQKLDAAREDLLKDMPPSAALQAISWDVSSSTEFVTANLEAATAKFGPVDILVNCAGTSVAKEFCALADADFDHMYRVNVLGSVYSSRAVVPSMKRRGRGHIVFVSSQAAQAAIHGYTAYAASKWALRGLAEALQMELQPFGVAVSLSFPPDTDTPGFKEEMLTKPLITTKISETGTVLKAPQVARDIVAATLDGSRRYAISSGMDGFLLKQLHGGMTPVTNAWEVCQQVYLASLFRLVAVGYLFYWQHLVHRYSKASGDTPVAAMETHGRSAMPA